MTSNVNIIGVNMVKFEKPGKNEPYEMMASMAIANALKDAGISLSEVDQAYASYVYGDSTSGQTALYRVGRIIFPLSW